MADRLSSNPFERSDGVLEYWSGAGAQSPDGSRFVGLYFCSLAAGGSRELRIAVQLDRLPVERSNGTKTLGCSREPLAANG
jgi:hypothetical protein